MLCLLLPLVGTISPPSPPELMLTSISFSSPPSHNFTKAPPSFHVAKPPPAPRKYLEFKPEHNSSILDFDNDDLIDIDFGNQSSTFYIKGKSFGNITVNNQNISFSDETHIEHLEMKPDSKVYIHNRTSFKSLNISKHSELHLRDCDISSDEPIHVNGTIDISGTVSLINTTLVLLQGSSFTNTGTISLGNSSQIVVSSGTVFDLTNNITSTGSDFGLIINGTVQASTIVIDTPIFMNTGSLIIIDTLLTVHDVLSLASMQVDTNATLLVQNSKFILNNSQMIARRRKLLQVNQPGNCVFHKTTLTGNGVLDCNVIFNSGYLITPSLLTVESLYIDSTSILTMDTDDVIISVNDVTLGGVLTVDLSGFTSNFTLIKSEIGRVIGTFSSVFFIGSQTTHEIVYTSNSVDVYSVPSVQLEQTAGTPEPEPDNKIKIIAPIVVCGCLAVLALVAFKMHRKKLVRKDPVLLPTDKMYSCINPLNDTRV
jgi:hypothetical protein